MSRPNTLFATALLAFMIPVVQAGGLSKQMDKVFDVMTYTTQPQIIMSQNRGVFAGRRYTTKNRISQENLLSLTPPSWKAGCGGIDMFGGSASFIRMEEFVQLLRSVGANTAGYAFLLGLDNVFPDGAKWIESMQRKIQSLNQHLGDSCQLAQGFVNDATSSMDLKHKTDASLKATGAGIFGDFFAAKNETGGDTPMQALKKNKNEEYIGMIGNLVWKQLQKNGAYAWFGQAGGDDLLLEAMMSLTGTVIIGDIDVRQKQENTLHMLPGNQITLNDIIEGGDLKIYSCDRDKDNCLCAGTGKTKTISLVGLRTRILNLLQGSCEKAGIIAKYANNSGELTAAESAFLVNLPDGMGTIFRNLSVKSPETSSFFAAESSAVLALTMAHRLADALIKDTITSQLNSDSPYKKEVMAILERSQGNLREEFRILSKSYGSLSHQVAKYNALVKTIPSSQYLPFQHSSSNRQQVALDSKDPT